MQTGLTLCPRARDRDEWRTKLEQRIEDKLTKDNKLATRLGAIENEPMQNADAALSIEARDSPETIKEYGGPASTEDARDSSSGSHPSSLRSLREFERLLQESRVYKETQQREGLDNSIRSGTLRSSRLSSLSHANTPQISTLSFVAIPIQISGLTDRDYYERHTVVHQDRSKGGAVCADVKEKTTLPHTKTRSSSA